MRFDEGKIVIEIELGNDAMREPVAVAEIVRKVADEIGKSQDYESDEDSGNYDTGHVRRKFRDVNGNTVAFWKHVP